MLTMEFRFPKPKFMVDTLILFFRAKEMVVDTLRYLRALHSCTLSPCMLGQLVIQIVSGAFARVISLV